MSFLSLIIAGTAALLFVDAVCYVWLRGNEAGLDRRPVPVRCIDQGRNRRAARHSGL